MRARRLSVCLAIALIALPYRALTQPAVPEVGASTLKHAVDMAWSRAPAVRTLDARQDEAAAARESARSWIAGNPVVGVSQRRSTGSSREQQESELALSSPLWLPGQRGARTALADRTGDEAAAQLAAARLAVAGEVRVRYWEAASAEVSLQEKRDHLHHMEDIAGEVDRRVKAGDLARSDYLLAHQEVLAAQVEVARAASRAAEALAGFRVLTGLSQLPPEQFEPLDDAAAPLNVRLASARATEERARAALRVARKTRSGAPTLSVLVRDEKDNALLEPVRSVGVALQVPIGSKARNRPAEAAAQTAIATAAAEAALAQAEGAEDVAVARARLENARLALDAAKARADALHEHTALIDKAFRLGERGLAELLRSRALAHEADIAAGQQRIALGLAHAQLNQALGRLP